MKLLLVSFAVLCPGLISAKPVWASDYRTLRAKSYEEMEALSKKHIIEAREEAQRDDETFRGALTVLQKGLTLILMHPVEGANNALILPLKNEMNHYGSFSEELLNITQTAIAVVKSPRLSTLQRASQLYVLEAVLFYIASQESPEKGLQKILQTIVNAKIKVPEEISAHRLLHGGKGKTISPSAKAKHIQNKFQKKKKKKKKRKTEEKRSQKAKSLKSRLFSGARLQILRE